MSNEKLYGRVKIQSYTHGYIFFYRGEPKSHPTTSGSWVQYYEKKNKNQWRDKTRFLISFKMRRAANI